MAITINGSGTITGISAGGLPDGCVTNADLANSSVTVNGTAIALGGSETITAGKVVQYVSNCPDLALVSQSTASWTEISSSFRVSITPLDANNILILTASFMIGGNNSSTISHLRFYDVTNASYPNLSTSGGSRTPVHAAFRQVDHDVHDCDTMTMQTTFAAGSTSARTYAIHHKNEGTSTTTKYFFGGFANVAAIGIAKPVFTILELAV